MAPIVAASQQDKNNSRSLSNKTEELKMEIAKKDAEMKELLKELGVTIPEVNVDWVWICQACTMLNIDGENEQLRECEICLADRFESKHVGSTNKQQTTAPSPSPPQQQQRPQIQAGWRCQACTSLNTADTAQECFLCFADRVASPTIPQKAWICQACFSANANSAAQECSICFADRNETEVAPPSRIVPTGWKCRACTSFNENDALQECAICNADREVPAAEGWCCAACTSFNAEASCDVCSVCYADREIPVSITTASTAPGQWTCEACRSINTNAHATECAVCFADRSENQPAHAPTKAFWRCKACISENSEDQRECSVCACDRDEPTGASISGWQCPACTSFNTDLAAVECKICSADKPSGENELGSIDTKDISGGKREMLDSARAVELLQTRGDPRQIKTIVLKTKSFGSEAAAAAAPIIKSMMNIEYADFSDIIAGRPTDEALGVLKLLCESLPLGKLKSLDLSDNALGERGIRILDFVLRQVSPNIEVLSFRNNGLSELSIKLLVDALGSPKQLRGLHFFSNMSGDGGAVAMTPLLQRLGAISQTQPLEFTMSSCRVRSEGSEEMGKALASVAHRLVTLDLSDSIMGDKGGQALASTLASCRALKKLILNDPGVPKGPVLDSLLKAIGSLKQLEFLDLTCASLGTDNVRSLITSLQANCPNLRVLKLAENEAKLRGIQSLFEDDNALSKLPELEHLDLRQNDLNDKAGKLLAERLKPRTRLLQIELADNDFADDVIESLQESLGGRLASLASSEE